MVRFAASVILLAISACVSAEDQLAKSGKICQSYGFSPGTDAYADCVQYQSGGRSGAPQAPMGHSAKESSTSVWSLR